MNLSPRIFALVMILCLMAGWPSSAQAARLASVSGEAGETEKSDFTEFKLGEPTDVSVDHDIAATKEDCSVKVLLYREQNGGWLIVSTVVRANRSVNGSKLFSLPAGSYRIRVEAVQAKYSISVEN